MMRSIVATTLTAAVLALVACETAPGAKPELAPAIAARTETMIQPGPVPATLAPAQVATEPAESTRMLDDLHLVQTERGLVLTLEDATFDKDLAVIKPGARRGLDQLAKFLHDNPGRRVQIEAFTDAEGSSVYNLELSQDRADAVAMAVINRGVEAARVRAIGWGERFAVADDASDQRRQRDRRVEIIVSKGDAAVPVRVVNAP